ncbi:MAG: hypothetical protein RBT71_08435 [Flavobacteriales bacterium]|jgi:hypothetical protein|nr:hypothetical protein [Flavobacteriales bacterium]
MMRRCLLILPMVPLSVGHVPAQTAVLYSGHDAYVQGAGEPAGTYRDIVRRGGRYLLRFQGAGAARTVACADIWGFTVNDVLFRVHPQEQVPVRLMAHGAVCYYENGFAHLRMQRTGSELEPAGPGHRSYIGRSLDGAIVPAVFTPGDDGPAARFRAAHPQLEVLFECIGGQDDLDNTRQCVVDFEALLEGDGHLRAVDMHRP